jgi:hypothetical protein
MGAHGYIREIFCSATERTLPGVTALDWSFEPVDGAPSPTLFRASRRLEKAEGVAAVGARAELELAHRVRSSQERLPVAHDAARQWYAVGLRSAALPRGRDSMRSFGSDNDLSRPDPDLFEPQNGGWRV